MTVVKAVWGRYHGREEYRIFQRKGRSIFGKENIKKSGCGLYGETVKKIKKCKSKPAQIRTYGTTNCKITIPLWYRTFPHILPTILSCIFDMKTKIISCQCIAKVKEGPVYRAAAKHPAREVAIFNPFQCIHQRKQLGIPSVRDGRAV